MIPQNCNTTLNMQMLEEAREDMMKDNKLDTPNIREVIAKVKAFNAFMDELEHLGYPQYNAICSFNGWTIQQTEGKRTP